MNWLAVPGQPIPQGSMRAFVTKGKAFVTSASPGPLARYRSDIHEAWDGSASPKLMTGPILLDVTFEFQRPKAHYLPVNKKRTVRELRDDAPRYVTNKPDIDKLLRAVLDALTGRAYRDDAEVVRITTTKVWAEKPQTVIYIKELQEVHS